MEHKYQRGLNQDKPGHLIKINQFTIHCNLDKNITMQINIIIGLFLSIMNFRSQSPSKTELSWLHTQIYPSTRLQGSSSTSTDAPTMPPTVLLDDENSNNAVFHRRHKRRTIDLGRDVQQTPQRSTWVFLRAHRFFHMLETCLIILFPYRFSTLICVHSQTDMEGLNCNFYDLLLVNPLCPPIITGKVKVNHGGSVSNWPTLGAAITTL